jgi:UDP-N-acetylmuramate dehydrogenase
MIRWEENISLRPYNTFGIDAKARFFCRLKTENDLTQLFESDFYKSNRVLWLGGGSNLLFLHDFDGLVIKNELLGIEKKDETAEKVELSVASGVVWHELVMHCVAQNWGGVENLSLIPGTVGAAPMQNIGAYGVEAREVIKNVSGFDLRSGAKMTLSNQECEFGYRESIFKHTLKEKFFISSVTLTLTKKNHHINTSYGAIQDTLTHMNVSVPTLRDVSDAVIHIRQSKLPDPLLLGNAGSFFKNPTIAQNHYDELKKTHPFMPGYISENQQVKVPAGWLIEQCGWKGKRINEAGVHAHQALVLINYGSAKGDEIFSLAREIQHDVTKKFGINLTTEVNIIS